MPETVKTPNGSPTSENTSEQDQNPTQENQNQNNSQPDGSGTGDQQTQQMQFNHPALKGKTPEEIERIFKLQEATVFEQRKVIDQKTQQQQQEQGRQNPNQPVVDANALPDAKAYWEDPVGTLNKLLDRQVAPLREEIRRNQAESRSPSIRDKMKSKYPEFAKLEPAIDAMMSSFNLNPKEVDENTLETVYHATYSKALHEGFITAPEGRPNPNAPNNNNPQQQRNNVNNAANLQHRPSAAPQAQSNQGQPNKREWTENERRLAREYFPKLAIDKALEAYESLQNASPEDVVDSTAGM